MKEIIFDFLKKNIALIVVFLIICIIILVLIIRMSLLSKENADLELKIKQKEEYIERLVIDVARYEAAINEMSKQRAIEETLIEKKQETEKELACKKEEAQEQIKDLMESNDEVKTWCEEPIPSELSTIFIINGKG